MIFAKINPTAKTTRSINPFQTEVIESDYMTVIARNYGAGAKQVNFEVVFGVITDNAFYKQNGFMVTMTDSDFVNWGADDTVLLNIVATKIGTVATDIYETDLGDQII